jgi:hypothetical protein
LTDSIVLAEGSSNVCLTWQKKEMNFPWERERERIDIYISKQSIFINILD